MVNELLVAEVRPELEAVSVFPPAVLTDKLLKVARPEALVVCVVVPFNVPLLTAMEMETPELETLLLKASWS